MNRRAKGIVLLVLGLAMVAAATLMYALYDRRDTRAGQNVEKLLFEISLDLDISGGSMGTAQAPPDFSPAQEDGEEQFIPAVYPEMDTADYFGLATIGVIKVPDCGIELPVLADWNYSILEYAPCRYGGNIYAGDLIIMGHNYRSHFKPLKSVEVGARVEFIDVNGLVWQYSVEAIESLHRDHVEELYSDHELVLFTCEEYGVYRFVARCRLEGVVYPEAQEP